jgi:hypothetical protein
MRRWFMACDVNSTYLYHNNDRQNMMLLAKNFESMFVIKASLRSCSTVKHEHFFRVTVIVFGALFVSCSSLNSMLRWSICSLRRMHVRYMSGFACQLQSVPT